MYPRLLFGSLIQKFGYTLLRTDRVPDTDMDLVALAFNLLRRTATAPLSIVQIGAFDGKVADSLVHLLKADVDCRALLVEPQPAAFAKLQAEYGQQSKISLANVAIADHTGTIEMQLPSDAGDASPFASMNPGRIRQMQKEGRALRPVSVASSTVIDLAHTHQLDAIDLMVIDTEGHDFSIFQQFIAAGLRPKTAQLESRHLPPTERSRFRELLVAQDYTRIDAYYDTLAICKSLLAY